MVKMMNSKTQRLSVIRKIIRSEFISSQEELIARLEECGVQVTQSTLSRDLKFMQVAKVPNKEKGYVYVLPNSNLADHQISTNITDNITQIAFSGNMCVITTKPGYASAISVPIDSKGIPDILGSIAGDNNIFLVLRENFNKAKLMEELTMLFPSLSTLYALEYERKGVLKSSTSHLIKSLSAVEGSIFLMPSSSKTLS